jgi:hypothetical protein
MVMVRIQPSLATPPRFVHNDLQTVDISSPRNSDGEWRKKGKMDGVEFDGALCGRPIGRTHDFAQVVSSQELPGRWRIFLRFRNFFTCELLRSEEVYTMYGEPTLSGLLEMTFFHVTCANNQFRPPAKKWFSRIFNFEQQPQLRQNGPDTCP